jgi:hypothetical protein
MRTYNLWYCVIIFPTSNDFPPHFSPFYRLECRRHPVRLLPLYERALPPFPGNCDATYYFIRSMTYIPFCYYPKCSALYSNTKVTMLFSALGRT